MSVKLVEGWTERIIDRLSADGTTLNLTGMTVQLVAYDKSGVLMTLGGTAGIVSGQATDGQVYFDPAAGDLLHSNSPMKIRWKVTASGKVAYFPNGAPESWEISKP